MAAMNLYRLADNTGEAYFGEPDDFRELARSLEQAADEGPDRGGFVLFIFDASEGAGGYGMLGFGVVDSERAALLTSQSHERFIARGG